jgi:hypothetical protein
LAVLFVIDHCKQFRYPSTDNWLNNQWYIHSTEYYSETKRKEISINTMTWMNVQRIMEGRKIHPSKIPFCVVTILK